MRKNAKGVGLAIIGAGRVGLFRGEVAARHPAVEWIGIAELNHNRGGDVAARIGADFVTTDYRALLARPEVTAAIIATDEHLHVAPILAAVERGVPMLIEKPLATDLAQSARVLKAITEAKVDAVVGYTQRFRRKCSCRSSPMKIASARRTVRGHDFLNFRHPLAATSG
jgi:myo-inositol 2-dehydrogenase / D-chiro-inositol 1-dehydrogenase